MVKSDQYGVESKRWRADEGDGSCGHALPFSVGEFIRLEEYLECMEGQMRVGQALDLVTGEEASLTA